MVALVPPNIQYVLAACIVLLIQKMNETQFLVVYVSLARTSTFPWMDEPLFIVYVPKLLILTGAYPYKYRSTMQLVNIAGEERCL